MVVVKINVIIIIIIIIIIFILNIIKPPNVALSFNINNHESKITDYFLHHSPFSSLSSF